jgi:hypothetical protein
MTGASSSKKRAKKNHQHDELLAFAIRDFTKHKGNSRVLDVKVDCMLKDEGRRKKEEQLLEREEE